MTFCSRYVDGKSVFNLSHPCIPNKPSYLMANLAIGGGWPGTPDSTAKFPNAMEIDYIRFGNLCQFFRNWISNLQRSYIPIII